VVSFTPQPLYPQGNCPWYPLGRRLGGCQSRSGRGGEEINSQPLSGLEPQFIQSVAQHHTTELSQLLWEIFLPLFKSDKQNPKKIQKNKLVEYFLQDFQQNHK
jgi:hypothetical protein